MKTKAIVYGDIFHKYVHGRTSATEIHFKGEPEIHEVLGLLGDEGLEPQIGMKVWDSTFGDGEIVYVYSHIRTDYPVEVRIDNGDSVSLTSDGRLMEGWNRTCYVTEMPDTAYDFDDYTLCIRKTPGEYHRDLPDRKYVAFLKEIPEASLHAYGKTRSEAIINLEVGFAELNQDLGGKLPKPESEVKK